MTLQYLTLPEKCKKHPRTRLRPSWKRKYVNKTLRKQFGVIPFCVEHKCPKCSKIVTLAELVED